MKQTNLLLVLLAFVVVDKIFCEFVCVYNILTAIGFFSLQFTVLFVCVFHLLFSVCVLQMKCI